MWLGAAALAAFAGCAGDDAAGGKHKKVTDPSCEQLHVGPSPMRRLTRHEYNNTVRDLIGMDTSPADSWVADGLVHGFDNNASVQAVTATHAQQFMDTADDVAEAVVEDLAALLPCDPAAIGDQACAEQLIDDLVRRAYRRPVTDEDRDRLLGVFLVGYGTRNLPNGGQAGAVDGVAVAALLVSRGARRRR